MSSTSVYAGELKRVQQYLDQGGRRKKFEELQERVQAFFEQARYRQELSGCIQSVFTRAKAASNLPIKSDKKIAIKLYKWRNDPRDGKVYHPSDIHDIAAASVICYYPSDLQKLIEYIQSETATKDFSFGPADYKNPNETGGYSAYHVIVEGRGRYSELKCELQLKTVLTQAWGIKTHDLTYKPAGFIDRRLAIHMEKLSQTINLVDEQSELLKQLITEAWVLDVRRRKAARMAMIMEVKSDPCELTDSILAFYHAHETELASFELNEELVNEFDEMLETYRNEKGTGANYCRLMAVFALNRDYGDLNDRALGALDNWIDQVQHSCSDEDHMDLERKVLIQRSVTAMALGEYDEAIENGRAILESFEKAADRGGMRKASANLAYFLSEACYHRHFDEATGGGEVDSSGSLRCGEEALQIVQNLEADATSEGEFIAIIDTRGAVRICCGEDENAVRDGLEMCRTALSNAEDSDSYGLVKAFFDLHEKRAFRRILELS